MNFDRRDFLKTAGAAAAVGTLAGCREREQALLTQAVGRPKVADGWHEWVCNQCSGACGAQVRIAAEEAKKIEGRADDPSSRGGLCALGQSALQEHYDPDRYREPRCDGEACTWETALERATDLLAGCSAPEDLVVVTADPSLAALAQQVSTSLGGDGALLLVDEATVAEAKAAESVFGRDALPRYDVDGADLIVTWGASVIDAGRNPVYFARSLAERGADVLHVHVGPRLSLTAAKADLWLAPRPGTLGFLAAALGAAVAERRARPEAAEAPSLEDAATVCDVPLAKIEKALDHLAASQDAVVVAGAEGVSGEASLDVAAAMALNGILGATERGRVAAGSGRLSLAPELDAEGLEVGARSALAQRLAKAKVAILADVDPVPGSVPSLALESSLASLEGVIALASEAAVSAETATVLLPCHSGLERLQFAVSEPRRDRLVLAAPVVPPRYDTRHPADVLLALAAAGGEPIAEGVDAYLAGLLAEQLGAEDPAGQLRALRRALGSSVALAPPSGEALDIEPLPRPAPSEPENGTLVLGFASVKHHQGRGLNRPWLQELPDPLSTVLWQGWAQISPQDAISWHVQDGDWLDLSSGDFTARLPAVILPSVRPGVVEVPRGYGAAVGRFAQGRGVDVAQLLGDAGPLGTARVDVQRSTEQTPVALYGRGLGQSEHLPRGWGSHETETAEEPVVELGRPQTGDEA